MVDFRVSGEASIDPDRIIEDVDMILEKLDELRDKVDEIDLELDRLANKGVDIEVNIRGEDKLIFLRDLIEEIDSRIYFVDIEVNIKDEYKLDELKLKADEMDAKRHQFDMDININGAAKATTELVALDKELNNKEKDMKNASKAAEGFQFSMLSLLPLLTAVIPVAASAGAGIIGLAGAFAVMAPALLGIVLAAKPAFTEIQNLTKSLDKNTQNALANAKGYDQIYNILNKNSAQFRAMNGDLQGVTVGWFELKNAYTAFQKAVAPAVFPMLEQGLDLVRQLLSGLPALVRPAAAALQSWLLDFSTRLKDPTFKSFFADMKNNMSTLVSDWATGILNIIEGLAGLFHAFMPITMDISGGFLRMTQSFDQWAQKLAASKGFQNFVSYVQTNGPIALNIIGQLIQLISHIAAALSGMGGGSLQIIDKLLQGLNHLATTSPALFKLVTTVALLGFSMSKLLPLIGPIVAFLMTPVGAIAAVLIAVGAGFIYAYEHSKTFRDWVQKNIMPMWNDIVNAAKGFITWIKGLWPDIIQIWDKYGKTFLALVKNLWDFVGNIFQAALKVIKGIVDVLVGLLTGDWNRVRDGIEAIVSGLWQAVESLFRDGVKIIVDIFAGLGEILYNIGKAIIQGLWNGMKDVWNSVSGWLGDIGGWISNLKGPIEKDRTLLTPHGKVIIQGLMDGMQSKMPAMASQLKGFGKMIEGAFGTSYSADISAKVRSSLGDANYNLANYQQGGSLPSTQPNQVTFAAGAIQVYNAKPEQPGITLTRVLTGAARMGTIQAPVGYTTQTG